MSKVSRLHAGLALVLVVVIAPLVGCFAFSPVAVASGLQPYPLAAALSVMGAEAIAITLALLIVSKKS